ncbi:MAG: DUF885 family protein [Gemmatimonadaceae bacterium]
MNSPGKNGEQDALDAFFAHYYAAHPVNATFTGVHTHDKRLPDWSSAQVIRDAEELDALRVRLETGLQVTSDDYRALSENAVALDTVLTLANIRLRLLELSSKHFQSRNPALWTGEAIFGVVSLMIRDFASPPERLPAITARLHAVPEFLQTMRERLTFAVPERWRDRAVRECSAAVELFGAGLDAWIAEHFSVDDQNDATGDVLVARNAAQPACAAFAETGEWLRARAVADASAYAVGETLFGEILRDGHFCDEAPRTLLQRAEAALHHERERLGLVLNSREAPVANSPNANSLDPDSLDADTPVAGSRGSSLRDADSRDADSRDAEPLRDPLHDWPHAQAAIAADHPTTSDYYESFARRWREIHEAVVAHDAVSWPHWPIRYVPIQGWARTAAPQLYWLFYRSPAPFDSYSTYQYVVTPIDTTMGMEEQAKRLAAWNNSAITLNHVVHHGGVGHHVQNWNATHRSSSRVGTVAAVDCASRIGMFLGGSMAEGWACYATELVEELGLLTPLETISQQHTRVRQLARAVVDIRLHTSDWSFAECAQFYVQQSGMSVDVANAETTKNSMFPGTALMYWLGTQGIIDLRQQMQTRRGEQFNLRAFHDALLSRGSIPVPLLARLMLSQVDHA